MEKEKLVELSDHEIHINFIPNTKCRTTIQLRSLVSSTPIAFKLQTSSPQKFLVNPSCGLIPPLSSTAFQIILKPQIELPTKFPKSPTDRFLLRTVRAPGMKPGSTRSDEVNLLFSSKPNLPSSYYDVKLKVYFLGPILLTQALNAGDFDAVRGILKRQRSNTAADALVGVGVGAITGRDGRTALWKAAARGDREMVELLLEAGADPTVRDVERGCTAIDVARDKGHMDIVKLLEQGKPLLDAARRGELDTLESLLEKGANINFCDQYGLRPLHIAAIKGNKDAVMMLVEFGADMECQDIEGHTPLHLAVEGGSIETVEILINRGANVNAKTKKGATPLYIARLMEYEDVTQLLLERVGGS